ncbi:hypothetical protein ACNKHN_08585 [Shigella flexneri]
MAVATIGAVLPGDFQIKPAKLRGEPSEGMLCPSLSWEFLTIITALSTAACGCADWHLISRRPATRLQHHRN